MKYFPLKEVCIISMGQAPPGSSYNENNNGFPLIAGAGDFGESTPNPTKFTTLASKLSEQDDIILCIRATIGNKNWSNKTYCLGRGVAGLRAKKNILDCRYLWYWLETVKLELNKNAKGSTFKQINKETIEKLQIPLPPLEEQKRIAAILDKADGIRRKQQEAIRLTEELLRSTFLEMFGNVSSHRWEISSVENIAKQQKGSIRTGPFGSQLLHSEFVDSGIAVLGIDNAVKNEFSWAKQRFITEEKYKKLKRYKVYPGDVIISIMGTCGRCAIVPQNCPEAINTKHLCCITLDLEKCIPEFLHSYFLIHPNARHYLQKNAKGAIMDGLNMEIIKKLPIPLPPLSLQRNFKSIYYHLTELKQSSSKTINYCEDLFNSLLQRAFRGEL